MFGLLNSRERNLMNEKIWHHYRAGKESWIPKSLERFQAESSARNADNESVSCLAIKDQYTQKVHLPILVVLLAVAMTRSAMAEVSAEEAMPHLGLVRRHRLRRVWCAADFDTHNGRDVLTQRHGRVGSAVKVFRFELPSTLPHAIPKCRNRIRYLSSAKVYARCLHF